MSAPEPAAEEMTPSELSLLKFLVPGAVQFNCYRDSLAAIRQHTAAAVAAATRELREDKERLYWLAAHSYREGGAGGYAPVYIIASSLAWPVAISADGNASKLKALRAAIDTARKAAP